MRIRRSDFAVFIAFSAISTLTACNGVEHLESVKSKDFTAVPKNVYGYIQPSTFASDKGIEDFKKVIVLGMAECGIRLQFQPGAAMSVTAPPGFDYALTFRELGHETATVSTRFGAVKDNYNDMYRLEVMMTELATHKSVWKSQGDFRTFDNAKSQSITRSTLDSTAGGAWARTMIGEMKKDGLVGDCRSADAITPGPVTAAVALPVAPVPSTATVVTAPAAATATTPAKPGTIRMNNVTYASLAEAETGMRASNAQEVAQIVPFSGQPRESLVIVGIPDKKPVPPAGQPPESMDQIFTVMQMMNRVGYDTALDAIRKSNLFKQVTLVREADVADSDFKGAAYKMSFSAGSWGLVKPGGARQKVQAPVLNSTKIDKLNSFLKDLQQAAATADGAKP